MLTVPVHIHTTRRAPHTASRQHCPAVDGTIRVWCVVLRFDCWLAAPAGDSREKRSKRHERQQTITRYLRKDHGGTVSLSACKPPISGDSNYLLQTIDTPKKPFFLTGHHTRYVGFKNGNPGINSNAQTSYDPAGHSRSHVGKFCFSVW